MFQIRGVLSTALLVAFVCCAFCNDLVIPFRWYVHKQRASLIPVVGGLCGFLGVLVAPIERAWIWSWAPFIMDIGCVPLVLAWLLNRWIRKAD